MRTLKTLYKRKFALFLAVMMCVSMPQLTVLAGDLQEEGTPPVVEEGTPSDESNAGDEGSGSSDRNSESGNPEEEPWTERNEDGVEVTVTPEQTADGTDYTWSGEGENDTDKITVNGEAHVTEEEPKVDEQGRPLEEVKNLEGQETVETTPKEEPDPTSSPVTINPGDTGSKDPVEVTVMWGDIPKNENGEPVLPQEYNGYELSKYDGTIRTYTKKDDAGNIISVYTVEELKDETGTIIGYKASSDIKVNKDEVVESELVKPQKPDGYGEADENGVCSKDNADGSNSTWKTEAILENPDDPSSKVIGYKEIETTTFTKTESIDPDSIPAEDSDTVDEYGNTVKITVEPLTEGNGRKVTKTVTNKDGKVLTTEVIEITTVVRDLENGTSTTETIAKTTTIVTTETISSKKVTDVTDGKVDLTVGTVTEDEGHGNLSTESLKPNMSLKSDLGQGNWSTDLWGWENHQIYEVTTNSGLKVRDTASISAKQTGSVAKGSKVYVSETQEAGGYLWGHIKEKQGNEWVNVGWIALAPTGKNPYTETPVPTEKDEFGFYGEYGLSSAVAVGYRDAETGKDNYYNVHQFVVYDAEGKKHYAYCADLSVSPEYETIYGIENVEDASFLDDPEMVNSIATNGYWGTSQGIGSLEAFKTWLRGIGYSDENHLKNLTGGQAMAITQAAIWYYASSGDKSVRDDVNPFAIHYYGNGTGHNELSAGGKERTEAIYQYLIQNAKAVKEHNVKKAAELINADDVTSVSIAVKKKVDVQPVDPNKVGEELAEIEAKKNSNLPIANPKIPDYYQVDVSFALNVTPSVVDDSLIVNVIAVVNGEEKVIATRRLADKENKYGEFGEILTPDENGKYTITDIELPEGTTITLNLTGYQTVSQSAYLIRASAGYDASQTFISVETGKRDVNLNVNMSFDVSAGTAVVESVGPMVNTRKDRYLSSRSVTTYSYDPEPSDPPEDPPTDPEDPPTDPEDPLTDPEDPVIPDEPVPLSDDPGVEIPDEPTPLAETPVTVELAELPDEEVPLTELPDEIVPLTVLLDDEVPLAGAPELTELLDEDVPLADVPATGDISVVWYMLIFLAGSCLLLMTIADAKKRRESLQN